MELHGLGVPDLAGLITVGIHWFSLGKGMAQDRAFISMDLNSLRRCCQDNMHHVRAIEKKEKQRTILRHLKKELYQGG